MRNYRDLVVWKRSHAFTVRICDLTLRFPKIEIFALASQMRRSSSSIGMNLAEGCGRQTDGEFARSIQIAMGSASELEYQLLLARDLKYLLATEHVELESELIEIRKMLNALYQSVNKARFKSAAGGTKS
jgi:four helix bundle protein